MNTVIDILKKFACAVLIQRHGAYLTGHIAARLGKGNELYAANYSRKEPDCVWPLTIGAIQECHVQGKMLVEAGVQLAEIVGSHQARGPETGMRVDEGIALVGGQFSPFRCDAGVDYPVYDYEECLRALNEVGDPMVAEWLNGKRPDLIPGETPDSFLERVMTFLAGLVKQGGHKLVTTHFEILTLVHALCVDGVELGQVSETWFPVKKRGSDSVEGRVRSPVGRGLCARLLTRRRAPQNPALS
jgi:hypothetical protein